MTGWFGIPGGLASRSTKVHYVRRTPLLDRVVPICGSRVGRRAVFQWCAGGFDARYVECDRCRRAREALRR
jgi:hypothetical protein